MNKKILVLDDKSEFRRLTKAILSNKYDVETAENGLEALSILQSGDIPDLIVSDLMMPILGGEGFLEQIKKSGALRNIPLIFLSSIDDKEQRERLLAMGANDYLLKPYNPAELLACIETIFKSIDSKSISESQKR